MPAAKAQFGFCADEQVPAVAFEIPMVDQVLGDDVGAMGERLKAVPPLRPQVLADAVLL